MTSINLLHDAFCPADRVGNGCHGSRHPCSAVVLRELPCREDAGCYQQHALAPFVHLRSLALSPCVRHSSKPVSSGASSRGSATSTPGSQMPILVGHKGQKQGSELLGRPKPCPAPESPQDRVSERLIESPVRESDLGLVGDGQVLTNKAARRLREDCQLVHRLRSASSQLDRRSRCCPCWASCRCVVRQHSLHLSATRVSPSSRRATGQVPQDRGPRSQAENRSAVRRARGRHGRAEP